MTGAAGRTDRASRFRGPVSVAGLVAVVITAAALVGLRVPVMLTLGCSVAVLAALTLWCFAGGARSTALALVVATLLAAGLFALEGLLRIAYRPAMRETLSNRFMGLDPELGTITLGSVTTRHRRSPRELDYREEWDVVYRTEADGARIVPGRPGTGPLVALFGDSFAFGEGLDDDRTIAARLQDLMPGARIYNYGVRGHGTAQNLLHLRRVLGARPDMRVCLVTFILADMRRTVATYDLLSTDWAAHLPRVESRGDSIVVLGRAVATLGPAQRLHVAALAGSRLYRRLFLRPWRPTPADWSLMANVVTAMRGACEGAGDRHFLFVMLPADAERSKVDPQGVVLAGWKLLLQSRGVQVLDLSEPFDSSLSASGRSRASYFFHDGHPGAEYADWVAGRIAPVVAPRLRTAIRQREPIAQHEPGAGR